VSLTVFATAVLGLLGLRITTGLGPSLLAWAVGAVAAATVVYVAVITFRLVLVMAAQEAPVMRFTQEELRAVPDSDLPGYSLLVPLHREERVLPALIAKLSSIDYPADRLQVLLLIEEDDEPTRAALDRIVLDSRFEVVLVPPSQPRTKPKACNVGLSHARGEFCVIYDAEDRPEPDQLRKAVAAFRRPSMATTSTPGCAACHRPSAFTTRRAAPPPWVPSADVIPLPVPPVPAVSSG
jgi:cellulose synthase/poly-beta-1,6-N-acetylglucosamine synthase-like glycosyltransferase